MVFEAEYTRVGTGDWVQIFSGISDLTYLWNVSGIPWGTYQVRIREFDEISNQTSDWSAPITVDIRDPSRTPYPRLWFEAEYMREGQLTWTQLFTQREDLTYLWEIEELRTGPYRLRVRTYDTNTSQYSDWSEIDSLEVLDRDEPLEGWNSALDTGTQTFDKDQQIAFEAEYWNTAQTVPSEGLEYAVFDMTSTFSPGVGRDGIENALSLSSGMTNAVLGYDGALNYRMGVIPLLYQYWGAGAPPGARVAKRVVSAYKGTIKETSTGPVTFVFGGQGSVRAYITRAGGTVEQIVDGPVKEPRAEPDLDNLTIAKLASEAGYQVAELSVNKGDVLEVYHWHDREPWGGVFCKVIPDSGLTTDWTAFSAALRDAAPVSSSFAGKEALGDSLLSIDVPYLIGAEIRNEVGSASSLQLQVPITTADEPVGYQFKKLDDQIFLVDNEDPTVKIRKGRLITFRGGYKRPHYNLVTNPSFETGDFTGTAKHSSAGIYTGRIVTSPVKYGTYAAELEVLALGGTGNLHDYAIWGLNVPAHSRKEITLSAHLRAPAGRTIAVRIVRELDGQPVFDHPDTETLTEVIATGDWQRISATLPAYGGSKEVTGVHIRMGMQSDNAGAVLEVGDLCQIDGIMVTETPGVLEYSERESEIYPRFTGYIEDIERDPSGDMATLTCRSFEGRMLDTFDEVYPDRLSYHANGFVFREWRGEPVWNIPAFDAWPLETALAELSYRSGIDPNRLGKSATTADPSYGHKKFRTNSTAKLTDGALLFSARHLADNEEKIRIERNANYGNVGLLKKDFLPDDDPYLFKTEVTERLFDDVKRLSDHYGYDFLFNAEGNAVLSVRNNPQSFEYLTTIGDPEEKVSPSGVGGRYFEQTSTDPTWQKQIEGYFSRVDLYAGIGENSNGQNGGLIDVLVEVWDGTTYVPVPSTDYNTVVSTYYNGNEGFYYDDLIRSDNTNATVLNLFSLPFDKYRVTLTPGGKDSSDTNLEWTYRLNGLAIFERDPVSNHYKEKFSTLENTLRIRPESRFKDLRNHVIVVGARKATVTDSSKFDAEENPNNPGREFHVAVAADPHSIYDPTSPNFVGSKRMAVIFDDKVVDSDFANWLARTVLYRFRSPKNSASFEHTAVPVLQLRDAVHVVDERYGAIDHVLWVNHFSERWAMDEATVQIDGESSPEIPSYQPREDIPIDELFDHDGDGKGEPVINVRMQYKNIFGQDVSNIDLAAPTLVETKAVGSSAPMASEAAAPDVNNEQLLLNPVIPETLYLSWNVGLANGSGLTDKRALVNHPYRHFYDITSWSVDHKPTLHFDFQEGDGTADIYDEAYYKFPSGTGSTWFLNYDYMLPRTGNKNPFYDPYTSEVGNLTSVQFDALISGRYRVSIWDARKSGGHETPVAWLTNPVEDPEEPEAHWTFLEAGSDKTFLWDGVDNIGFWNRLQSQHYADTVKGAFGEAPVAVGGGFYAWNDQSTNLHTQIGDPTPENYASDGSPFFTIGRFGQFYVKIEVLNDELLRKNLETEPREVTSEDLANPGVWNDTGEVYAWTHLGEPTQCEIKIEDWDPAAGVDWSPGTLEDHWVSTPAANATIRDGQPVRMTFQPIARRGILFEEDPKNTSVKMSRFSHLKATVLDQFWTLYNDAYKNINEDNSHTATRKRLTNRMYHDEDHTLSWQDESFRSGTELQALEWIFQPEFFEKDFGAGLVERLRYGDYEQIEALPGFNPRNSGGSSRTDRAYMNLAFMSYLFYFSAHALDRSGRRQWCLNRNFVDKSKIVTPDWLAADSTTHPEYAVDYVRNGAQEYLARSIFARQWVEPGWADGSYAGSPVTEFAISDPHELKFVQLASKDFDPYTGILNTAGAPEDKWALAYKTAGTQINEDMRKFGDEDRDPTLEDGYLMNSALETLGTWDFDRGGLVRWFLPAPSRDFHPYWRFPWSPDWSITHTDTYTEADNVDPVFEHPQNVLKIASSQVQRALRDPAAQENWGGFAYEHAYAEAHEAASSGTDALFFYGARLGLPAEDWVAQEDKGEEIEHAFDYVKQDNVDRFDQYRGVRSRGPYANRDRADAEWSDTDKDRDAPVRPVRPAGYALLNLGNYDRYFSAPMVRDYITSPKPYSQDVMVQHYIHFVREIKDFFDIRFRNEFVWYNDRHFPVTSRGAAYYSLYRNEYTKVRDHLGRTKWEQPQYAPKSLELFYDAGAWTGWKDDATTTEWSSDPFLRWAENILTVPGEAGKPAGGDGWGPGNETGPAEVDEQFMGVPFTKFMRANIFDEWFYQLTQRLAVGPRTPENSDLIMNLTLPARLRGQ